MDKGYPGSREVHPSPDFGCCPRHVLVRHEACRKQDTQGDHVGGRVDHCHTHLAGSHRRNEHVRILRLVAPGSPPRICLWRATPPVFSSQVLKGGDNRALWF
ncbi:MAG: hypothetical protein JWN28_607 [Candidatus Saccharibacteria bacterium]|nr:hypothetical protein [Candidatus Saccharibacteria bacterium]